MDPSNPWSYYNRLIPSGIASTASNEFQHQSLATTGGQPVAGQASTAASILLQAAHASGASTFNPGAFITPTPVAYESVFNPIFHQPKPAHFNSVINSQHRQNLIAENIQIKAAENALRQTYNEQQSTSPATNFYTTEQSSNSVSPVANANRPTNLTTWQQNSTPTATATATNNNFVNYSKQSAPSPNNQQYYRQQQQQQTVSPSYSDNSTQNSSNVYTNTTNNVTTPQQKERRPRKPQITTYHPQNLSQSNLSSEKTKTNNNQTQQTVHLVQTKTDSSSNKLYPHFFIIEQQEQIKQAETPEPHQNEQESSSSSSSQQQQIGYYAIVDGRLVYTTQDSPAANNNTTPTNTVNPMQTPGHFYLTNTGELIIAPEATQTQIKNETQQQQQTQQYAVASAIKNETISNVIASPQKQSPVQSSASSGYSVYNSPVASSMESQQSEQNIHYTSDASGHVVIYKTNTTPSTNRQQQQITTAAATAASSPRNQVTAGGGGGGGGGSGGGGGGGVVQSGSVAYSSVITRATGDQTKIYKQQQQSPHQQPQQQQQNWWENEVKEEPYGALHGLTKNDSGQQQQITENILVTTERPLAAQVQLIQQQQQQQQQQQHQQQHIENQEKIAPKPKKPRKPRKTKAEKAREELMKENEYLASRAEQQTSSQANDIKSAEQQQQQLPQTIQHHQQQQQQQQQNGYYDFNNRWNLQQQQQQQQQPQQQTQQNAAQIQNFNNQTSTTTAAHQLWQNQSLPQHHAQIPYFNPLQVPSPLHPSHPLNPMGQGTPAQQLTNHYPSMLSDSTMMQSLTAAAVAAHHGAISGIGASLQQQQQQQQQQSDPKENEAASKVVVPNIEEELGFLSDPNAVLTPPKKPEPPPQPVNTLSTNNATENSQSKFGGKQTSGAGAGFMSSYLKFLQGERETSPPTIGNKSGRNKSSYAKVPTITSANKTLTTSSLTTTTTTTPSETATTSASGSTTPNKSIHIQSQQIIIPAVTDQQSTLEQTAAKRKQSTNDTDVNNQLKSQLPKKARPQMAMQMASMQNRNQPSLSSSPSSSSSSTTATTVNKTQHRYQNSSAEDEDPLNLPPRRETSLRKAKTRRIEEIMNKSELDNDDFDEPQEFTDSDTDPVWTPEDEENENSKPGRSSTKRKKSKLSNNFKSMKSSGIDSEDEIVKPQPQKDLNNIDNSTKPSTDPTRVFRTGEFVVIRSDLVNDWPPIWQIEGQNLIQKYEPFCQNGKWLYKNTSGYSSCNAETRKLFIKAPVRIRMQNHTETIVEFMRSELLPGDTDQYIEKIMKDFLQYKDNFEIYLQTLISQSLDSSFMTEITKECDEYFLSNIRIIDELMENCKRKLLTLTPWTRNIIISIETFPLCNVITELGQDSYTLQMVCAGCHQPGISVRFLLCGQPYNNHTMETIQPDFRVTYEKDMLLCRICAERADIFHKIAHEKRNLFETCTKRVHQEKLRDPFKGTTMILKDIMADVTWIDELFTNLRTSWAEVESLERQRRFNQTSQ